MPVLGSFGSLKERLYNPDGDGNSKLDHVQEMLKQVVFTMQLPFATVLMDSWYATKKLMAVIEHSIALHPTFISLRRMQGD
jgi:hypothetical protein